MFCVGAGRRVIMSRCYSRHSSSTCAPSRCRALRPAHPFPDVPIPAHVCHQASLCLPPPLLLFPPIHAARRKIMLLPPTSVHPRTQSQRRNQRCVTCGNGRKEEGSDRHFQARSTKRRQKRCPTIIPETGRPATVSWTRFNRYVSRVLS